MTWRLAYPPGSVCGGRPPREPRRFRFACWSRGSASTALIPRLRSRARWARGVGVVRHHRIRGGAKTPRPFAGHPHRSEQVREHLRVAALARPDGDDHGTSLAVAQLMDLRRQTATRSPDRMIDRLGHLHHVIRWSPPRGAWCSSRAGGHARWSNRPQHPNRSRPWCLPWSTRPSGPCPRSRRLRSGGAASTPSATDRTPQAGPATQRRSGSGR